MRSTGLALLLVVPATSCSHFAGSLRDQLPATLRLTVTFRDDNGHRISSEVSTLITPP